MSDIQDTVVHHLGPDPLSGPATWVVVAVGLLLVWSAWTRRREGDRG